ncbi:MAG: V-type ATP synthase subunit I [Thermoplasmatota archaeon]
MTKSTLLIHHRYLDDVIRSLHETGLMEINTITKEQIEQLDGLQKATSNPEAHLFQEYETRLATLINILQNADRKPNGIKALLHPQLPITHKVEDLPFEEISSYVEGIMTSIEKEICTSDQQLQQLREQHTQLTISLKELHHFKQFDLVLSDVGVSEYLIIKAGKTQDITNLLEALRPFEATTVFSHQIGNRKKLEWAVIIVSHIMYQKDVERIITEHLIESTFPHLNATPTEAIDQLEGQLKTVEKQQEALQKTLKTLSKNHLSLLLSIREQVQLERIRKELPERFAKTDETIIISGWVLEDSIDEIKNTISAAAKNHVIFDFQTPSTNPDNPPTYIKTPEWAQSFRTLLGLFATPRYTEVNPTIIMGIFFILFFGFMLGDAGYGLVLLLLCLFAYVKFKKYSPMIKNWSFVGIWLGLVTTIIGLLTNSFFGDFIPRFVFNDLEKPLFQTTIAGIHFPVEPLNEPLTILTVALIFGLIHMNIGIILGIIQSFKERQYKLLLTKRLCWIPLQIGGGLLIGYYILDWSLIQPIYYAAMVLVVIGIIQLFISEGPIGFFGITGYVGDWLSYARLLALGLATSGMALAFNVVASLLPELLPYVGVILLPIVLVIAHLVNFLLQVLGAGVHSLRLQYVEFFNRFYEGGGHEFSPFTMNRVYTTIEKKE